VVGAQIDVGSRVSGRVVDLPVKVGDRVEAGDLLARLDAAELDARIAQARAELGLARAELEQVEDDAARRRSLVAEGVLPEAESESARRDLEVARAKADNAAAVLQVAEIQRGYTRIEAPIPGVIAAVSTREGETVAASFAAPTFVTILDPERLEVRAFVDETDIGRVFVGQTARFTVDTYPEVEIPATVTAIQPQAELLNNVVNYVVTLEFDVAAALSEDDLTGDGAAKDGVAEDGKVVLRPEMTAHVRLDLEARADVLTVPRRVIHRRNGREFVSVRRGDGWEEQEVQSGWRSDGVVEIVAGLEEGEVLRIHPQ